MARVISGSPRGVRHRRSLVVAGEARGQRCDLRSPSDGRADRPSRRRGATAGAYRRRCI